VAAAAAFSAASNRHVYAALSSAFAAQCHDNAGHGTSVYGGVAAVHDDGRVHGRIYRLAA